MADKEDQKDCGSTINFIIAVIGFTFFIAWELTKRRQIVDLRLLGQRNFALACIIIFFGYMSYFAPVSRPALAKELEVRSGDIVELRTDSGKLEIPIWILPGQAKWCTVWSRRLRNGISTARPVSCWRRA
jgi:hypothetical protein